MKIRVLNENAHGGTIVFMSGLFAGGWIWNRILNDFPNNKLVVFEDSITEAVDAKKNFEEMADEIAEVLKKLDLENTVLVGNSLGSLLAVLICNKNHLSVKRVVISGCPGMNKNVNLGIGLPSIVGVSQWLDKLGDQLFYDKEAVLATDFIKEDLKSKLIQPFKNRFLFLKMVKIAKKLDEYSISHIMKSFDIPSLGVWGDKDSVTPVKHWEEVPNHNRNFKLHVVSNCGHSPMIERPAEFSGALQSFIAA